MHRFRHVFCLNLLTLGLSVLVTNARADGSYTIQDLGLLPGGNASWGYAINASGQITGEAKVNGNAASHAYRTTAFGTLATATDLGVLPGGTDSRGYGINASGQITGFGNGTGFANHAFRTTPTGTLAIATDLGVLSGGDFSNGKGINASGQITGTSTVTGGASHAFRTTATGILSDPNADLGVLSGGSASEGFAINDSGQVTGNAAITANPSGTVHVFRTTATGTLSDPNADLGTLGGTNSYGLGINASGQITGYSYVTGTVIHAFRTTATGTLSDPNADLGALIGGGSSQGFGINAGGQVTGAADFNSVTEHAFLYTDGLGMQDLNSLLSTADRASWLLDIAYAINDSGQITGHGIINFQQHAFRMTPIAVSTPEPGSLTLLACLGLAGSVFLRRRKRT